MSTVQPLTEVGKRRLKIAQDTQRLVRVAEFAMSEGFVVIDLERLTAAIRGHCEWLEREVAQGEFCDDDTDYRVKCIVSYHRQLVDHLAVALNTDCVAKPKRTCEGMGLAKHLNHFMWEIDEAPELLQEVAWLAVGGSHVLLCRDGYGGNEMLEETALLTEKISDGFVHVVG